jgi:hypothetical protein
MEIAKIEAEKELKNAFKEDEYNFEDAVEK